MAKIKNPKIRKQAKNRLREARNEVIFANEDDPNNIMRIMEAERRVKHERDVIKALDRKDNT